MTDEVKTMARTTNSEKLIKMERDIEYIKLSIDELKENLKDFQHQFEKSREKTDKELAKKVDRNELWKIISITVSIASLFSTVLIKLALL